MKLNNTFAIGCLVQWYEIEIIEEYLQSVKNSIEMLDNKKNVIVDFRYDTSDSIIELSFIMDYIKDIIPKTKNIIFNLQSYVLC